MSDKTKTKNGPEETSQEDKKNEANVEKIDPQSSQSDKSEAKAQPKNSDQSDKSEAKTASKAKKDEKEESPSLEEKPAAKANKEAKAASTDAKNDDVSSEKKPVAAKAEAKATTAKTAKAEAKGSSEEEPSRRGFLSLLGAAWISFAATMGAATVATARFMFPNVLFEPPQQFKAGVPDDYIIGEIDERWKEKFGVWLGRTEEGFYALLTVCTHLGCTPNWLKTENKFKCPCHGSGFTKNGINFEGPAPRPLERVKIYLASDGQIVIDKSRKFQQEKGQWNDPDSFLKA